MSNKCISLVTWLNKQKWLSAIAGISIAPLIFIGLFALATSDSTALDEAELLELVNQASNPECVAEQLARSEQKKPKRLYFTQSDIKNAEAVCKKEAQIKSLETLRSKLSTQNQDVVGGSE